MIIALDKLYKTKSGLPVTILTTAYNNPQYTVRGIVCTRTQNNEMDVTELTWTKFGKFQFNSNTPYDLVEIQ